MPKVGPSDVAQMIVESYPWATSIQPARTVGVDDGPRLAALLDLIRQLPEATLTLPTRDYRDFVWAVAGLTHLARRLERGAIPAAGGWDRPAVGKQNALTKIWLLLRNCPDEGMEASTASLEFIDDAELRTSIRLDVSSSEAALNNGQWKAATVLAGATVEALLLWSVTRHGEVERHSAVMTAGVRVDSARPEN